MCNVRSSCNVGVRCRPQANRRCELADQAMRGRGLDSPLPNACHRAHCLDQKVLGDQNGVERSKPEIGEFDGGAPVFR